MRDDLPRVAVSGDVTIQEADLVEDLMVDGETYGCVKSFCYQGDTIDGDDPGMSLKCAQTRGCRKSASRPGYVVKGRTDSGYVVKQCPRIAMNKIFDWH